MASKAPLYYKLTWCFLSRLENNSRKVKSQKCNIFFLMGDRMGQNVPFRVYLEVLTWSGGIKGHLGMRWQNWGKKTKAVCQQYTTQSLIAEQWHISVSLGRPGLALLDGNVWWLRAPTSIILPWGIFLLLFNSLDEPQRGNLEEPNRWLSSLQWLLLGECCAENSMARVYQAGMYWSAAKMRNITSCGQISQSPALHLAEVPQSLLLFYNNLTTEANALTSVINLLMRNFIHTFACVCVHLSCLIFHFWASSLEMSLSICIMTANN